MHPLLLITLTFCHPHHGHTHHHRHHHTHNTVQIDQPVQQQRITLPDGSTTTVISRPGVQLP